MILHLPKQIISLWSNAIWPIMWPYSFNFINFNAWCCFCFGCFPFTSLTEGDWYDEAFGSLDYTSEDRTEEKRKIRGKLLFSRRYYDFQYFFLLFMSFKLYLVNYLLGSLLSSCLVNYLINGWLHFCQLLLNWWERNNIKLSKINISWTRKK